MPVSTRFIQQCLKQRIPTYGTWITFADSEIARTIARSGAFHWLAIDCEHGSIDFRDVRAIAATVSDSNVVPLCRIPCGRHDYIKRALDAGCLGIIAPMVETVEEAQMIIRSCYYPPLGNRSYGPGSHYLNLKESNDMETYFQQANDEIIVLLQTESPTGIQNAPYIYKVPGLHGILVGPRDLRGQLKFTANDQSIVTNTDFDNALTTIQNIAKDCSIPLGIHVANDKDCISRINQGWNFFTVGSDRTFLVQEAIRTSEKIRSHIERSNNNTEEKNNNNSSSSTVKESGSLRSFY